MRGSSEERFMVCVCVGVCVVCSSYHSRAIMDALFAIMAEQQRNVQRLLQPRVQAAIAPPLAMTAAAAAGSIRTAPVAAAAASITSAAAPSRIPLSGVGTLQQQMLEYISRNRNANTRKTYASGWSGFARYLEKRGKSESDLDEFDVADYLRVRVDEQGVAASTMGNDRAAIADHLKNIPHLKHVVNQPVVADIMSVLRTQAAPSKPKQHMAADLMREMVAAHDARGPSGKATAWLAERDIFLMLLMMMAFLREAEAVALTNANVEVKSVVVEGKARRVLSIFIARSKTDQEKVGHVVLLGEDEMNPACCPISRFELYQAAIKKSGVQSESFFPTVSGTAMAAGTPCGIVQRAVRQANDCAFAAGFGVDRWGEAESYGSHSLRRGGVTTARGNGVSMLDIQKHGRWKSLTVFSYVGTTPAEQLAVTNSFLGEATSSSGTAAAARDEVPSSQAHSLRAAAAGSGKRKKPTAAASASAPSAKGESDSSEAEEENAEEAAEASMFESLLDQGRASPKKRKATPARGAKTAAAAAAAKSAAAAAAPSAARKR